jgi:hypothetical protein
MSVLPADCRGARPESTCMDAGRPSEPSNVQVSREVIEAAKGRLKVVGRAGVGIDNVDLAAASEVRLPAHIEFRSALAHLRLGARC